MSFPQPGITNRPPEHLLLATFSFVDRTPDAARSVLTDLAGIVRRELASDLDDPNLPDQLDRPSAETGELGFHDHYDRGHLTITLGLSSGAFDALGTPAEQRPADLRPIPWDKLGDTPENPNSGDLLFQVCSDDIYVCEHVVRRVEQEMDGRLQPVWAQVGSQRYTSRPGRTSRHEGRALIGFLDGTSNLDPRNSAEHRKLVFIDPGEVSSYPPNPAPQLSGGGPYPPQGPSFPTDLQPVPIAEPDWVQGGTYMTVRVSTFDTASWDRESQNDQEHAVGRHKFSGASLDLPDEPARLNDPPAFQVDQSNQTVPFDAHVRKANPRRPGDELRLVFRRGYPLIAAADGEVRRGLAFVSFGRTTSTQFEFVVRAWLRNRDFPTPGAGDDRLLFHALSEHVLCGGYYFVSPLRHRRQPWSWTLPR